MRLLPLPALLLFLLAAPARGDGLPVRDGPAAAELVCEHDALQPGRSVTLAVVLHLDEGWHAYWINPGDAGQPPAVAWTLPGGYEVGRLAWPAPHRLVEGPITSFVYEDELVLPVTLHVPEDAPEGETTIGAEVTWLVCKDQCLPGKAEVSITRAVRAGATKVDRAAHERISRARDLLPVPVEAEVEHAVADHLTLAVVGVEGTPTEFFPEEEGVFDLAALGGPWTRGETGVYTLTLPLAEGGQAPERLAGVLVTAEPHKAFAVDAPVARGAAEPAETEGGGASAVVVMTATVVGLVLLSIVAMAVLRGGRRNPT